MSNRQRFDEPGSWHHVYNRAIAKRPAFLCGADYRYFLACGPPDNEAHVDHVIPKSKGGTNTFENAEVRSRAWNLPLKLDGGKAHPELVRTCL